MILLQHVHFDGDNSKYIIMLNILYGAPQSSILGPKLLILYSLCLLCVYNFKIHVI